MAQRLSAAASAGVRTVFAPSSGGPPAQGGVVVVAVRHVRDALRWAAPGSDGRRLEEVVSAG